MDKYELAKLINLIFIAVDESSDVDFNECEKLVDTLETIIEYGNCNDKLIASELLNGVQKALTQIKLNRKSE